MKYGVLNQKNPEYFADVWAKLDGLYKGGFDILKKASLYCPRMPDESQSSYDARLKSAGYINYYGMIVDQLAAGVFAKEFSMDVAKDDEESAPAYDTDFYEDFAKNCDRRGTSTSALARERLRMAMNKGKAIVAVDVTTAKDAESIPQTRADEETLGLGVPYFYQIDPEEMIDWRADEFGGFEWVILKRVIADRKTPLDARGLIVEEFKIWFMKGGVAQWAKLRTKAYNPAKGEAPKDDDDLTKFAEGVTSFDRIPLFVLDFTDGSLWIGDRVGPLAQEHFQRRGSLNAAENKSLVVIPVAKLGSEVGTPGEALPAEMAENPYRGNDPVKAFRNKGWMVVGSEDSIDFPEPSGACYALVDEQLRSLKDEMFRVVHSIAAGLDKSTTNAKASGDSKRQDKSDLEKVLSELAERVRKFLVHLYKFVSTVRGEKDLEWMVFGLDEFIDEDRATLVQEALQIDMIPINSKTFKLLYKLDVAARLGNGFSPEDMAQIKKELTEAADAETELASTQHEAAMTTAQAEADGAMIPDASPSSN